MKKQKFPASFYNPLSIFGIGLATVSFSVTALLMLFDLFTGSKAPYLGLITFIILPTFLILGLLIVPLGIYFEHRRQHKAKSKGPIPLPRIDFNEPRQRRAFYYFSSATLVLLLFTAVGSYRAFLFTEDVQFCGDLCHSVMHPEYITYQHSPHARVACVQCHVGSGASWYVRSKFSGAYQVYAVLFNTYPRPIPTPIKNLRPARETCEECHWPSAFHGEKHIEVTRYLADSANTPWMIDMFLKIGSGTVSDDPLPGVHWHVSNAIVDYVATDSTDQTIPWVKIERPGKAPEIFVSEDNPVPYSPAPAGKAGKMDCMDCHNRPTHLLLSPSEAIDDAIKSKTIPQSLPFIKKTGIDALVPQYTSVAAAKDSIALIVKSFYESNYPQVASANQAGISKAVGTLQTIYENNFFPVMRSDWRAYRNNIGHQINAGCFRCHDGKHKSEQGRVISNECSTCHIILRQGTNPPTEVNLKGVEFKHPVDIGDAWKTQRCNDCHDGTQ